MDIVRIASAITEVVLGDDLENLRVAHIGTEAVQVYGTLLGMGHSTTVTARRIDKEAVQVVVELSGGFGKFATILLNKDLSDASLSEYGDYAHRYLMSHYQG